MGLFNFVTGMMTGKILQFLTLNFWLIKLFKSSVIKKILFIYFFCLCTNPICTITGLYAGIYLTQNYNVPALPDPTTLVDKAKKFLEENKKEGKDWKHSSKQIILLVTLVPLVNVILILL